MARAFWANVVITARSRRQRQAGWIRQGDARSHRAPRRRGEIDRRCATGRRRRRPPTPPRANSWQRCRTSFALRSTRSAATPSCCSLGLAGPVKAEQRTTSSGSGRVSSTSRNHFGSSQLQPDRSRQRQLRYPSHRARQGHPIGDADDGGACRGETGRVTSRDGGA